MKKLAIITLTIAILATVVGGTDSNSSASASNAECQGPTDNCNPSWAKPDGGVEEQSDAGVSPATDDERPALEYKPVPIPKVREGRPSHDEGKQKVASCTLDISQRFKARKYNNLSRPEQLACVAERRDHLKKWRHAKRATTKRPDTEEETPEEPKTFKFAYGDDDVYAPERAVKGILGKLTLTPPPALEIPDMPKGRGPEMIEPMDMVRVGSRTPAESIAFQFPRLAMRPPIHVIMRREPTAPLVPFAMQSNLPRGHEIVERGLGGEVPAPAKAESGGVPLEMYGVSHVPLTPEQREQAIKAGQTEFARLNLARLAETASLRRRGIIPPEETPVPDLPLEQLRDRAVGNIARILEAIDETNPSGGMVARIPAPPSDPRLMALLREAMEDLETVKRMISARDSQATTPPLAQR